MTPSLASRSRMYVCFFLGSELIPLERLSFFHSLLDGSFTTYYVTNKTKRSHLRLDDHCHDEWNRFAHFDSHRSYTRNLIATDHVSYTLLLLCWNPGRFSPIHDHPCDGCWMRVLQGQVQECRYKNDSQDELICTQDKTYTEGGLVFIEDSLGYHKVGNPSGNQPAVTLHLYSPPFESCKIWLDESRKPCQSGTICHYSEYGTKI